ncbi:hypothetical protein PSK37_00590 [Escherichia coli]|nr:hypothetical protein [Escherichia coli]
MIYSPARRGMACRRRKTPQAYACLKCRRAARRCPSCPSWCEAFFCYVVSVVLISGGGDTFGSRLPRRHPVVRPDSDRQLLAHPPVSAEPAGAVSGRRYGPMSEKPGLQRPFRSRRPCRAGNGAPCTPYGV